MISNDKARDMYRMAKYVEEFSAFLKQKAKLLTNRPSPGAIVQDRSGRKYVYRNQGGVSMLDTMGNGGLVRPKMSDDYFGYTDWSNYDIVQDSPDPQRDLGEVVEKAMDDEDQEGKGDNTVVHDNAGRPTKI